MGPGRPVSVSRQHLHCGNQYPRPTSATADPGTLGRDTAEICGVLDAALSFVARNLRIRTQRASASGLAADNLLCEDRSRGFSFFNPIDDGRDRVVLIGSDTTTAVRHPWNHKQAEEVFRGRTVFFDS